MLMCPPPAETTWRFFVYTVAYLTWYIGRWRHSRSPKMQCRCVYPVQKKLLQVMVTLFVTLLLCYAGFTLGMNAGCISLESWVRIGDFRAISRRVSETVRDTNRKSNTRFRLVPKSTTLVDPEMTLDGNYALCCIIHMCFGANH